MTYFRCCRSTWITLLTACALYLGTTVAATALETRAREAFLIDLSTGTVLLNKNADHLMPPASMSKLMTIVMVLDRLKDGRLKLGDTLPVSEAAWRKGGSKMFVKVGERVAIEDLLRGIVIQSGNDACIVVAESLAGSEEAFARQMTDRAREIGLSRSTFRNATGWPDPEHVMTARELAVLAQYVIENYPEHYGMFAEKSFTYGGITQGNRNPLLYKNMGADGLKTGHTEASGYGLTASAKRGERRLVLVINGVESAQQRANEAERLIDWAFREFESYKLFEAGEVVSNAGVWLGTEDEVPLVVDQDVAITVNINDRRKMKVVVRYDEPVPAPIAKGDQIATLIVTAPGIDKMEIPLAASKDVEKLGLFRRLGAVANHLIWGGAIASFKE